MQDIRVMMIIPLLPYHFLANLDSISGANQKIDERLRRGVLAKETRGNPV